MKQLIKKILVASLLSLPLSAASSAEQEQVYPVVVLGGGIGALTSAVYLSRAGITPLVIEGPSPGGAIAQSHTVQNWPGELAIPGWELSLKVRSQAEKNGARFLREEVVQVDFSSLPYLITTQDPYKPSIRHTFKTYACIIGMGSTPNTLGIPGETGEQGYWGRGVYNCAVCDGSLFKEKTVAVVGGGDTALVEAEYLSRIAKKVVLIVRGKGFRTVEEKRKEEILKIPNIQVQFETTVKEIHGDGKKVTHLLVKKEGEKSASPLKTDAIFLAIGSKPNSSLFQGQLDLDNQGFIQLKKDQETSKNGIFAFGDIADPIYKQAISAAGDAAKAAIQTERYLSALPEAQTLAQAAFKEEKSSHSKRVLEISSLEQFEQEIKQSDGYVLVDFYATWCGPCKSFAPVFDAWAKEFSGKAKFLKINVDSFPELARRYEVTAMPTLLVLDKTGATVQKRIGTRDIAKAEDFLSRLE